MARIIKWIIDIIFVLVIILLIAYFVLRNMRIIEIYEVETGSMEDGIHPGDYVLILKKNDYRIGDVVTYTRDNYYVTHRIIREDQDGVVTKGDANNTEDDEISKNSIVGKVIIIGGILNIAINYKFGIISFLLGLYLLSCYFGKKDDSEIDITESNEEKESNSEEIIPNSIENKEDEKISIEKVEKENAIVNEEVVNNEEKELKNEKTEDDDNKAEKNVLENTEKEEKETNSEETVKEESNTNEEQKDLETNVENKNEEKETNDKKDNNTAEEEKKVSKEKTAKKTNKNPNKKTNKKENTKKELVDKEKSSKNNSNKSKAKKTNNNIERKQ